MLWHRQAIFKSHLIIYLLILVIFILVIISLKWCILSVIHIYEAYRYYAKCISAPQLYLSSYNLNTWGTNKLCFRIPHCHFFYLDITVMYMFWMAIKCFWIELKSKGDKLCSSAESRIWTRDPRHQIASRLNARWQTDWAIEDRAKNLNSTARPYDQRVFSPLDPTCQLITISQFLSYRYFPHFPSLSKQTLIIEYHIHIWQVSLQFSCGDTCQILM